MGSSDTFIAVDPSISATGAACFVEGKLVHVKFIGCTLTGPLLERVRAMALQVHAFRCDYSALGDFGLVIEHPMIYPQTGRRKKKPNPNDLMKLSDVVGAIAMDLRWEWIREVYPQDWKGQREKEVQNNITRQELIDTGGHVAEVTLDYCDNLTKKKASDVLDAVGLGLYHLNGPTTRRRK